MCGRAPSRALLAYNHPSRRVDAPTPRRSETHTKHIATLRTSPRADNDPAHDPANRIMLRVHAAFPTALEATDRVEFESCCDLEASYRNSAIIAEDQRLGAAPHALA